MTTVTKTKRNEFSERFIDRLENLVEKNDRGALAMLRRGLGKEIPFEAYRFIPLGLKGWQVDAALLVGPLFAHWYQGKDEVKSAGEKENLGASMLAFVKAMVWEGVNRDDAMKRVERRFSALLNCHADDLKPHLRYAVSLLKSKEVPINWRLLLRDVYWWSHEDRGVQRMWARSFWAPGTEGSEPLEEDVASGISEETDASAGDE